MDLSDYCRTIETHLCRKNDGHLIRIAGPSFDVVARWAADGIPVKVAVGGIDRYFERYYRKGPRRRPVKIDFCDNDVRDLFDEWRRATGVTAGAAAAPPDAASQARDATAEPVRRRGPSLPEHLERVLTRLSSLRVTGVLGDAADPIVDAVSAELDRARARPAGLRGDERKALLERLDRLDDGLLDVAAASVADDVTTAARADAAESLAPFRATMSAEAYADAMTRALRQALRSRLGLPVVRLT